MNNFESYFEIVAQDLGIAIFFTALLPILATLGAKAYQWFAGLYASFNHPAKMPVADFEKAGHITEVEVSGNKAKTSKLEWYVGRSHAEA